MKKIIIETTDENYEKAIAGLCYVAGTELTEDNAKAKLIDMIGQTVRVHQKEQADNLISSLLTSMNGTTTVVVE